MVELAIGCGSTLKSISGATCAKITDISLDAVGSHCKCLESMTLDALFIDNKGVQAEDAL